MIPLRVSLKNFLCYQDQVFTFEDHPVWLLHGPNGVGKSAIFDGMIYALFGQPQRNDANRNSGVDLIRRGESSLRVEFDFEFNCRRYRVWRTRAKNGRTTQGASELVDGLPQPVRDVNNVRELDGWVVSKLGLTYETFVSAVLLRQGAAEKLIDADKDVRRELFRGIIDLDPYIELHKKVTEARADLSSAVRALQSDLQTKPKVTEDQISTATVEKLAAVEAWENAQNSLRLANGRLGHARLWGQLDQVRRELRSKLDEAVQRAAQAGELKRRVDRLAELRAAVPALALVESRRRELAAAECRLTQLTDKQSQAAARQSETSNAMEEQRRKASDSQNRLSELDRTINQGSGACERLRKEIEQATHAADLHRQLDEKRRALREFEADIDARFALASTEYVEAQGSKDALPHLESAAQHRGDYKKAINDKDVASLAEGTARSELERLTIAEPEANLAAERQERLKAEAQQAAAVASDRLAEAIRRRDHFATVAEGALCSECGQPIDAEHSARELTKHEEAVRSAAAAAKNCGEELATATQSATDARALHANQVTERNQAKVKRNEAAQSGQKAEERIEAARIAYERSRCELSDVYTSRVSTICGDGFPTVADLDVCRQLKSRVKDCERERDRLGNRRQERDETAKEIATLTKAVAAVGAPPDVSVARDDLSAKELTLVGLRKEECQCKEEKKSAESAEMALRETLSTITSQLNELIAASGGAKVTLQNAGDELTTAIQAVPDSFGEMLDADDIETAVLSGELQELESSNAESEWAALSNDRALEVDRQRQMTEAELQIADLPEDARRPVTALEAEVNAASDLVSESDKRRLNAIGELERLSRQLSERRGSESRLTESEKNLALHQKLAELLGDKGIQLDLVREAERQIVHLANDVLNRVSSGDLSIEPPDPEADRSFDLSVRRAGCPEPISAANLSGGQRFRLAVSLALAVCKFANGEKIPLESVIIDEGFGSLDREGRMAMISELRDGQELSRMFKRVLIVSHQDDFASAFPVGYWLSSEGGKTVAVPFNQG
jgi:DNA repair protein SbcC/Rad50